MESKAFLYYYIISIFMMANDAFFTWLGMQMHLNFWRQVISLIGFYIVYKTLRTNEGLFYVRMIYRKYGTMFKILSVFAVISIVFNGYTLERVLYALWNYSFGLPFLLFPYYTRKCGWSDSRFNNLFIILGTFLSVGILIDFLSGGLITTMFLLSVTMEEGTFEDGRFCFLSTAPTIFTVYYCFCLFCLLTETINSKSVLKKTILLSLSLLFVFGSVFCGSRQTLAGLVLIECIGLWNFFKTNKLSLLVIALSIVISYFFLPQAQKMLSDNQGFSDRYTSEAIEEDDRTKTWEEGFYYCILNPTIRRALIGDGVGRTIGRGAEKGDTGKHYENTFLARINDVGWFMSFWMLLLPVGFMLKNRNKKLNTSLMYYGIIFAYLFIAMVSPNGAAESTQMSLFIVLGKFIYDNGLDNFKRSNHLA